MDLAELWRRLAASRTLSLTVRPAQATPHHGTGVIAVELLTPTSILWREQGAWTDGPLAGIRFSNTTRWDHLNNLELQVSHQRRGPDPVMLSTLRPQVDGSWTGSVHHCGDDHYHPRLSASAAGLLVSWEVTSPTDPYRWELTVR